MTTLRPSSWYARGVVRLTFLLICPLLFAVWLLMGLISMRRLGNVLVKTGQNLQDYDW